jgi:hypothetical protein
MTAFFAAGAVYGFDFAVGLIVQGWAVWKLRQSIKLARLAPFLIGGLIGYRSAANSFAGPPGQFAFRHRHGAGRL